MAEYPSLGPTGEFPQGQLNDQDEGGLNIAIGSTGAGTVMLDFGTPVAWIGLDPDTADTIADKMKEAAMDARKTLAEIPKGGN